MDDDNARTVEACTSQMGGVDVLVNNAGYGYRAEIGALDVDAMRTLFATNVFGLVDLTNRVVPLMKAQAEGDIVNIASTSGMKGAARAPRPTPAASGRCAASPSAGRPSCGRTASASSCLCPSEVQTNFGGRTGRNNPNKLYAEDIAATILAGLDMPRRVLWPELAVFATNPWKED